jgi:hypothetical protein
MPSVVAPYPARPLGVIEKNVAKKLKNTDQISHCPGPRPETGSLRRTWKTNLDLNVARRKAELSSRLGPYRDLLISLTLFHD